MKLPFSRKTPVIGAIMKQEERYLVEWVAWHKLQGFDIIVADNCLAGPQTALLGSLQRAGWIDVLDARDLTSQPQMPAYRRIYWRALFAGYRHMGFLDTDEFFEPLEGGPWSGATVVTRALAEPRVHATSFRWANFGSNGHLRFSDDLVLRRFIRRGLPSHEGNRQVKSFFRIVNVLQAFIARPIQPFRSAHTPPIRSSRTFYEGLDAKAKVSGRDWRVARIRHYAVKSVEELDWKYRFRGDVFYREADKPKREWYLERFDRNEVSDPLTSEALTMLDNKVAEIKASMGPAALQRAEANFHV